MENKKREYLAPRVEVKAVEIESSICNGSVEFGDTNHKIDINKQTIVDTGTSNDFSGDQWGTPISGSNN